ncbi:MAG: cupin domain-containing protein [Betaproteobacteria bacterium]
MDALSDVFRVVRLTGAVFLTAEFTAPWSVLTRSSPSARATDLPDANQLIHYHVITEGNCWLSLDGGEPAFLEAGDLIVFPHGDTHTLSSATGLEPVPTTSLLKPKHPDALHRLVYGGGGDTARMVCGFLTCDARLCKSLLSALPRLLKIATREDAIASWIKASLRSTLEASASQGPGSAIVLAKLAEALFVEAVRRYIGVTSLCCPRISAAGWRHCRTRTSPARWH